MIGLDEPANLTHYGEDPNGPLPTNDSGNNVIVSPIQIPGVEELYQYMQTYLNLNTDVDDLGLHQYIHLVEYVTERVNSMID